MEEIEADVLEEAEMGESDHVAADYAAAVAQVMQVAGLVAHFVPNAKVKAAVSAAQKFAPAVEAAEKAAPSVVDAARPAVSRLAAFAPGAVKNMAGAVALAGEKVGSGIGSALSAVAGAAAANPVVKRIAGMNAAKARRQAREEVIGAVDALSVKEFREKRAAYAGIENASQFWGLPGCYVVLLLPKMPGAEPVDYKQVYVGAAVDMGEAIEADLRGKGNPDVYADVKYDQNVRLLAFPCAAQDIEMLQESLIVALDADISYNQCDK